ncbi:hypothetical protein A9K71_21295 [Mesorhizobium sp. WSM3873]|nr:hypothetical protein A9K71_21295 [Mesorhizobium sp. WSM3873]
MLSHVRRTFYELHAAGSQTVAQMAPLWAAEEAVPGSSDSCASGEINRRPSRFSALWEKELPKLSGKSKPAEAIRCALAGVPRWNAS